MFSGRHRCPTRAPPRPSSPRPPFSCSVSWPRSYGGEGRPRRGRSFGIGRDRKGKDLEESEGPKMIYWSQWSVQNCRPAARTWPEKETGGSSNESVKISVVRYSDFQVIQMKLNSTYDAVGISPSRNCAVLKCNVASSRFSNKILLWRAKFVVSKQLKCRGDFDHRNYARRAKILKTCFTTSYKLKHLIS